LDLQVWHQELWGVLLQVPSSLERLVAMTITLQDLQVLEEKADANWYLNGPAFTAALLDYYHSGALQRLAELAEDGDRYRQVREDVVWYNNCGYAADPFDWEDAKTLAEFDAAIDSARAPSVKEEK
jgi:hypothetical protein